MPGILGHKPTVQDLMKLARAGELSHGYIFTGPAMVGKKTTALALAHFLEKGTFEAPGMHEVLQDGRLIDIAFARQLNPKVTNSIGIDAVREIKNFLWQKPNASPKRTLIIDDTELLTTEAQNALLKVTEEPPASSLLILIVSDLESIMGTIRSRLQQVHFGTVPEKEIAGWIAESAGAAKIDAAGLAKKAQGKPGLAWRLAHDKEFRGLLDHAAAFLKSSTAGHRDFIKKLIEPDDFDLREFLQAVIMTLAWEGQSKEKTALWHKTLALYQDVNNLALNPRLQLETLLMN